MVLETNETNPNFKANIIVISRKLVQVTLVHHAAYKQINVFLEKVLY